MAERSFASALVRQAGAGWVSRSRCSADAHVLTRCSAERQPLRSVPAQLAALSPLAATRCWASTCRELAYTADSEGPCDALGVLGGRRGALRTGFDVGRADVTARSAREDALGLRDATGLPEPPEPPPARQPGTSRTPQPATVTARRTDRQSPRVSIEPRLSRHSDSSEWASRPTGCRWSRSSWAAGLLSRCGGHAVSASQAFPLPLVPPAEILERALSTTPAMGLRPAGADPVTPARTVGVGVIG